MTLLATKPLLRLQPGDAILDQQWQAELGSRLQHTSLTQEERLALAAFITALLSNCGNMVESIILYGSAARGEERRESDVDLLIFVNREIDETEKRALHELAVEIEFDYPCALSPLVMTPSKQQWHLRGSSLWLNIQTDGIWLWSAEGDSQADRLAWPRRFTPSGVYRMTDVQVDEIRIHMEHAAEDLAVAELLLNSWKERAAIGHCYYAVFYAASALLLTKGIVRAKHSGVRSMLGFHFFKTGILPSAWSKLYEKLQEEREAATYDMDYEPGEDVAAQRLRWAQEFVETARTYLVQNGFLK